MSESFVIPHIINNQSIKPNTFGENMTVYHTALFQSLCNPDPTTKSNLCKPHPNLIKMLEVFYNPKVCHVSKDDIYLLYFPDNIANDHPLVSIFHTWIRNFRVMYIKKSSPNNWKPNLLAVKAMILYRILKCINGECNHAFFKNPHDHIKSFLSLYSIYQKKARDCIGAHEEFISQESYYEYDEYDVASVPSEQLSENECLVVESEQKIDDTQSHTTLVIDIDSTQDHEENEEDTKPSAEQLEAMNKSYQVSTNVQDNTTTPTEQIADTTGYPTKTSTDTVKTDTSTKRLISKVSVNSPTYSKYASPIKKTGSITNYQENQSPDKTIIASVSPMDEKKTKENIRIDRRESTISQYNTNTEIIVLKYELLKAQILLIDNLDELENLKKQLKHS